MKALARLLGALGLMLRVCSWCGKAQGLKRGHGARGISHGICPTCESTMEV